MDSDRFQSGAVLVLPGGKPVSAAPSRPWQLANLRMTALSAELRRLVGDAVHVRQVRYRLRGWNWPQYDALNDARAALDTLRERFDPAQIVLVGHSMGGRVAAHVSASGDAGAVVALAPWWPTDDAQYIPTGTRLLTVHGTADSWTDPSSSELQTLRAGDRGVDARWVGLPGAGHYMLREASSWNRLTAEFVRGQLCPTLPH